MDVNDMKYIVGQAEEGRPAIIRFFSPVDSGSVQSFNEEFLWLQNVVKPSKIIVMINSEGGSVLYGMSAFSVISSCPIEVDCIVEGIAASMASVIWTAGDNLYMHDYSLLMIHNPFNCKDKADPSAKATVEAFRVQLATIYIKRFGLSKEKVKEIMDGAGDADCTFLTAKEAVKAGIIPKDNVIKTSKNVRDRIRNQLEGVENMASIRDIMSAFSSEVDDTKLLEQVGTIHNQRDTTITQDTFKMENKETSALEGIYSKLGLSKDSQANAVEARIDALTNAEATLKNVKAELTATKIKLEGKEAELVNVQNELTNVKASLQSYKDAELRAREMEISSVIDSAIADGKIESSAKDAWITMAKADFETVKTTLASIQAREKITEKIAEDPANVSDIEDTMKDVDAKMREAIKAKLGDVTFEKF